MNRSPILNQSMRPEVVLLDFDHTLVHLGQLVRWDDARRELLPLYRAAGVPASFLETHAGALSLYGDVAASDVLPEEDLAAVQPQASQIIAAFELEPVPRVGVAPTARAVVQRLRQLEVRMGIVTSNALPVVAAVLERGEVASAFETIVAREHTRQLKPSPDGLVLSCERLGVAPQWCLYVGDSGTDMQAARAAGMTGFGVRAGNSPDVELVQAGAAAIFDDLSGLLAMLERYG